MAGTSALDLNSLVLNGQAAKIAHADIWAAVNSVSMKETITGASTLTVQVSDPTRTLLTSGLLNSAATCVLDGAGFELAKVTKSLSTLTLTFEDISVAALRQKTGALTVAPGTMSRAAFCTRMIHELPWVKVTAAPGAVAQETLSRGSGSSVGVSADQLTPSQQKSDKEDSWTACGRVMGEIGWRAWCYRGTVYLTPDSYLLSTGTPYDLTEKTPGVENIDLDWNVNKPAATSTITARTGWLDMIPGSVVNLSGLGPGDGQWLVETITRKPETTLVAVTIVRPQPTLAEPTDTSGDLSGNAGLGGYDSSLQADITGASFKTGIGANTSVLDAFADLALKHEGQAYIWGASGPTAFDCSGLVQYCANQLGISMPKPVSSQIATCQNAGTLISVQQAIATRGACLFIGPDEHVAISLGNGKTVEAMGRSYGVCIGNAPNRGWTQGGLLPGGRRAVGQVLA